MPKSKKTSKTAKIVVAGDVCIDWIERPTDALEQNKNKTLPNWKLFPGTSMAPREGGALLLARMVREARSGSVVAQPKVPNIKKLEQIPPTDVIHSIVKLKKFAEKRGAKKKVWRVDDLGGFAGPGRVTKAFPVDMDYDEAAVVLLDDVGNGYRNGSARRKWPKALATDAKLGRSR